MMDYKDLAMEAREARKKAYAPYSKYKVGAAVLTAQGNVYTGSNVENSSYGLSMCAERVALFKAVSQGEVEIKAVAIVAEADVSPCGACRQVLFEFAPEADVITLSSTGEVEVTKVKDFLPKAFALKKLP